MLRVSERRRGFSRPMVEDELLSKRPLDALLAPNLSMSLSEEAI